MASVPDEDGMTSARTVIGLCWVVVTLALAPDAASAQVAESPSDREAQMLFRAALEAYQAARYDRALDYFQRAYELSGRPELLFNIGQAADRAREDATALSAYERFAEALPDSPMREQAETRIAFLRAQRGRGPAHPAEREPRVPDEREREVTSASETERSTRGAEDALELTGETEELPLLVPGSDHEAERRGRLAAPVVTATGGALVATGVALLVAGRLARQEFEDAPDGAWWDDVSRSYARAAPLGNAGIVVVGAGLAAGVVGVVLFAKRDHDRVEISLGPGTLSLRGSF
jgi:tetratricopeptide (TPR) repeat protein